MKETIKLILNKLNNMDSDIQDLKNNVKGLENNVKIIEKHVLIIVNKQSEDSKALYDGYSQTLENTIKIKKI